MFSLHDMPINRKLTLIILLTSAGVLFVAGAATITTQIFAARRTLAADMTVLADLLSRNVQVPLSFHREEDVEEISKTLSAVQADPQIVGICVYDEQYKPFGHYARAGEAKIEFPRVLPADGYHFDGDYLHIVHPVRLNEKRIGTIYLRSDLSEIYSEVARDAGIVGLVLVGTIIVTIAVSRRLRRPIAEPILGLAAVARQVADRKDYSARATKLGNDEVGLLTDAFNQMLGEIETANASLQDANRSMQAEIAERKAVEERLRKAHDDLAVAKDAAEAANRAKDQFLAVLSHELRTPLTPVLLTVSLLQNREDLADEALEDIRSIRRHVELEARLIDDLLDLTRITRGKLQLNFEATDAHLLMHDAMHVCCSNRTDDIRLHLDARHHHVRADPARLLQVFWNLLNNAVKFTPTGQPITIRSTDAPGGMIRIEVVDRGVGIDKEALPRIFNAFEQADSSLTRTFGGLGLGLAIAKALIDAHGGRISAASDGKGTGATFTVELPAIEPPANATTRPTRRGVPASARGSIRAPLRLLVVEDHEGTLRLMTKLLKGLGHDVASAASVHEALELAEQHPIDLVISDLGLPDGSGLDVMRALRDRYAVKGIAVSGFGMDEDVRRSMEAGFVGHLTKPVDMEKLQVAIQQAVT